MSVFDDNPTWIGMAQDKVGQWYYFTGIPFYHWPSGRWICPFGGQAHAMGLKPRSDSPEQTLVVRPGMEEEVAKKQAEYGAELRAKLPAGPTGSSLNQGDVFSGPGRSF